MSDRGTRARVSPAARAGATERFARAATAWAGSNSALVLAAVFVLVWAVTGPIFHYSDAWQLVINTGTSIATFLMVFLIQRAQNKDALAVQLKLDELIAAVKGASNQLIAIEELSEDELRRLHTRFTELSKKTSREAPTSVERAVREPNLQD